MLASTIKKSNTKKQDQRPPPTPTRNQHEPRTVLPGRQPDVSGPNSVPTRPPPTKTPRSTPTHTPKPAGKAVLEEPPHTGTRHHRWFHNPEHPRPTTHTHTTAVRDHGDGVRVRSLERR